MKVQSDWWHFNVDGCLGNVWDVWLWESSLSTPGWKHGRAEWAVISGLIIFVWSPVVHIWTLLESAGQTIIDRETRGRGKRTSDQIQSYWDRSQPPCPQDICSWILERKKRPVRFFFCSLWVEGTGWKREVCHINDYINNFPGGLFKMLWGIDCFKAFKKHHLHTINMLIAQHSY